MGNLFEEVPAYVGLVVNGQAGLDALDNRLLTAILRSPTASSSTGAFRFTRTTFCACRNASLEINRDLRFLDWAKLCRFRMDPVSIATS